MGVFLVHQNHICLVAETYSKHVHGLRDEDINKRQNWGAAQRTCFPRARNCLISVTNGAAPVHDPMALGTLVYLELVYHYVENHKSNSIPDGKKQVCWIYCHVPWNLEKSYNLPP